MSSIGTKLDANQVLKQAYNESDNRLRVDAAVSATISDVKISDPDGDTLEINPDGSLNVAVTGPMAVEIDAADGDNIAISDGTHTLNVNPDGSINTQISGNINVKPDGSQFQIYNEVISVASGVLTTVVSHTIAGVNKLLNEVYFSGSNVAEYSLLINSSVMMKGRTYFGGSLNEYFTLNQPKKLNIGDVVELKVIHQRPTVGDFNGTLFLEDET